MARYSVEAALAEKEARYKKKRESGKVEYAYELTGRNRYGEKYDNTGKYSRVVLIIDTTQSLNSIKVIGEALVIFRSGTKVSDYKDCIGKYNDFTVYGPMSDKVIQALTKGIEPNNISGKVEDVNNVQISEIKKARKTRRRSKKLSEGSA